MTDKIILWEEGGFFSYLLANSLQQKHECEIYAIVDATNKRKKFFEKQQFVKFKKVWHLHDHISQLKKHADLKYLSDIEKKYDVNLWLLAHNERLFNKYNEFYKFTKDEILSILEDECRLFEQIISEVKPDFLITLETALHHHHLFYEMCRASNVKIMMLNQSKFGYKCLISQELHKLDEKEDLSNIESSNRDFLALQDYLKKFDMSKQLITHKNKFMSSKKEKIKAAFQFFISDNSNIKTNFGYYGRTKLKVLTTVIRNSLKKKYREYYINKNLVKQISSETPFVYFPLHQEPERVLLIGAPFYTNQLEVIKQIAKSLPIGFKLCVKEHPTQAIREWRPISIYKQIQELPNVELLHPSVKTDEIFKKCSLIITINGTAGLEGAFYGKPSIIFTDLGYSVLPSVDILQSLDDLPHTIHSSLQKTVNPADVDKYVNLLEKNSFDFDLIGFYSLCNDYFYYGGYLLDVKIQLNKMKLFLDKYEPIFNNIAIQFIKKIRDLKDSTLDI